MLYDITKVKKYGVFSSEKIGTQYYYMVYLHVYTDSTKTAFYKVHFITYFDAEDVCEYCDVDTFTAQDFKSAKNDLILAAAESICNYNNIHDIINECNYMIKRYA